jgi:hypothetical protein
MDVCIDRVDESTNSVYISFKSSKLGKTNIENFVSAMKRMTDKYGFKNVQVITKMIDDGGN